MKREYIIDGYNLMHAWADLKARMDHHLENARDALIMRLSGFAQRINGSVTVVFDGQEKQSRQHSGMSRIHVIYSKASEEADHVIKRLIEKKHSHSKLTVVSSDREIRRYAGLYRSASLTSTQFIREMNSSVSRPAPAEEKYDLPMTDREVDEWMRVFQERKED